MSSSATTVYSANSIPAKGNTGLLARLLTPTFSDCFYLAILIWLFLAGASGWKALLMDGDTGWHIRAGEYIAQSGKIPTTDLFSFSKPGAPWFAWEWLSDLTFAVLFRWGGLKAVVLFCGGLIALFSTVVLRFAIWRGANPSVAFPLAMLAVGSSTIHFLARPHLFTLLLLPVSLWMLEADRRTPSPAVWLLIPLTALWTNLHGGFALFLVCLALFVLGIAIESLLGNPRWNAVRRYGILLGGCGFATVLNPFGLGLHVHILQYLRSDWIRNLVQEFQAPTFRNEGQAQFELLLLAGLILVGRLIAQRRVVEVLWIVFLAHSALGSVRHAPLYAAIAAPILAAEITVIWRSMLVTARRSSLPSILFQIGHDVEPMFRRVSIWVPVALVVIACINAPIAWPTDFPKEAFPVQMVHRNAQRLNAGRVFTTDQWADYLIYSFYPNQKVFFDGRSDFYGEELGKDYLTLLQGGYRSRQILKRNRFDLALIPTDWALASILKLSGEWTVLEDDGHSILFGAVPRASTLQASSSTLGTNEKTPNSRTNN
jgi:hypothetical protein